MANKFFKAIFNLKSLFILTMASLMSVCISCQKLEDFKTKDSSSSDGYYIKTVTKFSDADSLQIMPAKSLSNISISSMDKNYIYVGEKNSGIHIYKNSSPFQQIGFISIPAMRNFKIGNGFLVCENGNDLISYRVSGLDSLNFNSGTNGNTISNKVNFGVSARKKDFFTFPNYPSQRNVYFECPDSLGYVIEWEKRPLKSTLNCYR